MTAKPIMTNVIFEHQKDGPQVHCFSPKSGVVATKPTENLNKYKISCTYVHILIKIQRLL